MDTSNILQQVTRTIYGSHLQTARVLRRPLDIREHTTLNEAINDEVKIPFQPPIITQGMQECEVYDAMNDSDDVKIAYVAIGNGGHTTSVSSQNQVSYMGLNVHQSTDAAPFRMLPFVCRPEDHDIPDDERANYRLRKTLMIDGELYVAYYLKVLDFSNSEIEMNIARTINGKTTENVFIPTINNLRTSPVEPGVENDGTKTYVTAKAVFDFTEKDVGYFIEACENMFGSSNEAIISELAFCSGVDKPIVRSYPSAGAQTSNSSITGRNLKEAVAVQVCCFANTYYQANFGMLGFTVPFDIGASEPLFGKTRR